MLTLSRLAAIVLAFEGFVAGFARCGRRLIVGILRPELLLRGGDHAQIMLGVLEVVFSGDRIAGTLSVTGSFGVAGSAKSGDSVERHVGEVELTPRQFAVLEAVAGQSGLSQTDIMAATGIDRSSTADLVRRLVANRCLQRRRTRRDARSYAVRVTPLGRLTLGIGAKATRAAEDELLGSIPIHQRAEFVQLLMRIAVSREE
jgi:DNA-binding MarR family transcriptional regulator